MAWPAIGSRISRCIARTFIALCPDARSFHKTYGCRCLELRAVAKLTARIWALPMNSRTRMSIRRTAAVVCGGVIIFTTGCGDRPLESAAGPNASAANITVEWWDSDAEGGQPLFVTGTTPGGVVTRFHFIEASGAIVSPDGLRCVVIEPPYCDHLLLVVDFSGSDARVFGTPSTAHFWRVDGFDPSGALVCTRWNGNESPAEHPGHRVTYQLHELVPYEANHSHMWKRLPRAGHSAASAD